MIDCAQIFHHGYLGGLYSHLLPLRTLYRNLCLCISESDLHLEKFCAGIHKQIIAIEERSRILTYDLARGPSSEKDASPYIIFTKTSSYSSTHSLSPTEKISDVESGAISTEMDRLIDQ